MTERLVNNMHPMNGRVLLSQNLVANEVFAVYANLAVANTQETIQIDAPVNPIQAYKLAVHNPSAITGLTLKLFTVEKSLGGADRDCLLETLDVPKAQTIKGTVIDAYEFLVGGIFCGGDLKIVASNDTALGAGDAFAASIRLREV